MLKYPLCLACFLAPAVLLNLGSAQTPKPGLDSHDQSQESAVIEQFKTLITYANDGTGSREVETKVHVQSDAGVKTYGLLLFSYQSQFENLDLDYIRVRKPDGTVVVTTPDGVQDMPSPITREAPFYSDLRDKHVAVKGLGPGDTLEYRAHWKITQALAPGQFWLDYNFTTDQITKDEELQVRVPHGRALKMKSVKVKPTITQEGGYDVYAWTHSNPEVKPEDNEARQARLVLTARGRLAGPDIRLSSFQSWDEIGKWYGGLEQERVKPTADIQAKAAELTKGAADDSAKLHAIYDFVSLQFRYIGVAFGIGRYQPHAAADVLANQYGDCKDKHTLTASLLQAAGIKAYAALISSSRELDPDVPSPSQFDHVITAVPQAKGFLWLDTTPEVAPFGYLMLALHEKPALVIADNQPAALVDTPPVSTIKSRLTFRIDAKLDASGTLVGKIERSIQGDDAEVITRVAFRSMGMPQWREFVQRVSYASGFAGDVSDVAASSPEDTRTPFDFSYTYTRKDYPEWSNHHITSPIPPFGLPEPDEGSGKVAHPIWLGGGQEVHMESHVKLPPGFVPEVPPTEDVKTAFADYHNGYSFKDGVLSTDRSIVVKLEEVPVGSVEEYKSLRKKADDDWGRYVELSSVTAPEAFETVASLARDVYALPDSSNPKAMAAEAQSKDAGRQGNIEGAIDYLKQAIAIDPSFTRDWLVLAYTDMSLHRTEEGMEALHKAVAAAPDQVLPLKILAFALQNNQKYEEAADTWRAALKLAPEDANVALYLGGSLLRLKRYSDAAAAYETAIKLTPGVASTHVLLGESYLRAGNEDKATAAFQRALDLDGGASTLNDLAYELAEANKRLPDALQYAEKAVKEEEDTSQKVQLSSLHMDDLQPTRRLAMYWDTLGWVYFRLDNLEAAERYLRAAWVLSQNPISASHLAQVYERQKRNHEALSTFRLALATTIHLDDDERATVRKHIESLGAKAPQTSRETFAVTDELNHLRTVKLPRLMSGTASAEVFVLIGPGNKVEGVKILSGSDKLKNAEQDLAKARFDAPLPDDGPSHLLRRGILGCYPVTGCNLVFLNPDSVNSVE